MQNTFDFSERLAMSQGYTVSRDVKDILLAAIPGSQSIEKASQSFDRMGVDWWVVMGDGHKLAVDAKIREEDWASKHPDEDDLALETWSVIENQVVGWTRNPSKRCDYILWLWQDTGRHCLLPFPMLCSVFGQNWEDWTSRFKTRRQRTPWGGGQYHSECVFVPRRIVWREIYQRYSGQLTTRLTSNGKSEGAELGQLHLL